MAERAALVTGGSSGIGLAIARALAEDGYGITLSARRPEKLEAAAEDLRSEGYDVLDVPAQMTDEEDLTKLVEAHRERFGRLRRAGQQRGGRDRRGDGRAADKHVDMQLGVNLRAVMLMTRECLPMLREAGGEHGKALIVNTASIAGQGGTGVAIGLLGDEGGGDRLQPGNPAGGRGRGDPGDGLRAGLRRHADDGVRPRGRSSQEEMIRPEDIAEAVGFLLRTSPNCLFPRSCSCARTSSSSGTP